MFFAYPAIANQQATNIQILQPGEGSFGNAYCGQPLIQAYGALSELVQQNVTYQSNTSKYANAYYRVPPSAFSLFQGNYITSSSLENTQHRAFIILGLNIDGFFINEKAIEADIFESLPPSFIIPANNLAYYPNVFCAKTNAIQLPVFATNNIFNNNLVSNTTLGIDIFSILTNLQIIIQDASFVQKSNRAENAITAKIGISPNILQSGYKIQNTSNEF